MTKEGKPALTVRSLSKSFGGVKAIDNVSLTLDAGCSRVLIGPNGAGKTTLFNLITGEIPMDEGEIYLFGVDISQAKIQKRSELGLTRTYQISNLFKELTVEENLYLSLKDKQWNSQGDFSSLWTSWMKSYKRVQRIEEVLASVGLEGKRQTLVSSLAHGEQRQLELGMAISSNPRIIFFDEPMAGLSPNERVFMGKLIRKLAAEKIILVIEHDMDFALSLTDDVTVLDHGRVIAEGRPEEIKSNPEVKKIYKLG
ncbi:ABC transporter ATP-binding protein [Desulfosporosinus fructosivorans]|uniref:ABC transporter ATP-binding protein n=1 Tax=Desulfosporosinus fructosivorans TaxID=2018669 RepID=A0A4Z0R9D0_9FIRM|nr:ABC transporter ATP-binding protein [Desulfosporosinus fructosivorans]TGE39752.1 ABC transporter ATP-binding protein [Desulfosporosinus fructosivorans]